MELFFKINTICGCLEQITKSTAENDDQYLVLVCKSAFLFLDLWKMLRVIISTAAHQSGFYIFPFEVQLEI